MPDEKVFKCPHDDREFEGERGWKMHMSFAHGGFTKEERDAVGASSSPHDNLKGLSGHLDLDSAAKDAPETEGIAVNADKKKKKAKANDEEEAKLANARAKIGGVLMRKAARMPYTALGAIFHDKSLALTTAEEKEIADAYYMLAEAYGADFTGKLWALMAVIGSNADAIAARIDRIMPGMTADLNAMQAAEEEKKKVDFPN